MIGKYAKIIGPLLALIGYFLGVLKAKTIIPDWLYTLLLLIGLFAILGYIVFVFVTIAKFKVHIFHLINFLSFPKKPFFLLKKELEYAYLSRTKMSLKKTFTIKSKQQGVHDFTDRYMWTKKRDERCPITPLFGDSIGRLSDDAHWHNYTINFSKILCKNEIHKTGIQMQDLDDPEKKSQLFLSTGIFEPTKELCLKVYFTNPLKVKDNSSFIEVYNTYHATMPSHRFKIECREYNGGYYIEYYTKYPLIGACYKLVWGFEAD